MEQDNTFLAGRREHRLAAILEGSYIRAEQMNMVAFPVQEYIRVERLADRLEGARFCWTYDGVQRDVRSTIGTEMKEVFESLTIPSGQVLDDDGEATYFESEYKLPNLEVAIDNAQERAGRVGVKIGTFEHSQIFVQELQYVGWRFGPE